MGSERVPFPFGTKWSPLLHRVMKDIVSATSSRRKRAKEHACAFPCFVWEQPKVHSFTGNHGDGAPVRAEKASEGKRRAHDRSRSVSTRPVTGHPRPWSTGRGVLRFLRPTRAPGGRCLLRVAVPYGWSVSRPITADRRRTQMPVRRLRPGKDRRRGSRSRARPP